MMNNENYYHLEEPSFFTSGGNPTVRIGFDSPTTTDDLPKTEAFAPGSKAYSTETGTRYTLTLSGDWTPEPNSGGGGGGGGVTVHNELTGRAVADAHPINAITGLTAVLSLPPNAQVALLANNYRISRNVGDTQQFNLTSAQASGASVVGVGTYIIDGDITVGVVTELVTTAEPQKITVQTVSVRAEPMPQVVRVALRPGNVDASAEGMTVQITLDKPADKDDYYIQPWRFRHTRGKHKSHQTYAHKPQIRSGFRKQDLNGYGCNLPIDRLQIPQNTTVFTIEVPLSQYARKFRARAGVKDKGNDFWKYDHSVKWKFSVCRYGANVPHKPEKGAGYADTGALPSAQTLIVVTPPPRRDETKPENLAAYIE